VSDQPDHKPLAMGISQHSYSIMRWLTVSVFEEILLDEWSNADVSKEMKRGFSKDNSLGG
jgi:hypothetical protein